MNLQQKIIKPKIGLLELAKQLSWTHGESIFRLGTKALAAQLEEEPSVRSAAVETQLDGSLRIWSRTDDQLLTGKLARQHILSMKLQGSWQRAKIRSSP